MNDDNRLARGPKENQGDQGEPGATGATGATGAAGMSRGARQAVVFLFALALAIGAGNLFWTSHVVSQAKTAQASQQAEQQRAGVLLEAKLCATLGGLASLKPPPGNPATNPSRAYLQREHAKLAQLGTDLGCKP